jgi:hypothetical protein
MDRKNLLIAGGLIGVIICLFSAFMIISFGLILVSEIINPFPEYNVYNASFDNSTPEATAKSVARLNAGQWGFDYDVIKSAHLTSDGKYWKVEMYSSVYKDEFEVITVDAKTWRSKVDGSEWKSLDELKASYIAEIQSQGDIGKPEKITMDGKEIWKVPVNYVDSNEYVYVDTKTGKSKNTWDEFNNASGTDGWLTLKQVDDTLNKMEKEWDKEMESSLGEDEINELNSYPEPAPFRNVLRDLYPE